MTNPFLQKKILVITAHPDDEAFFSGMLKQVVDSGGEVRLFCATLGEKGKSYVTTPHTPEEIKSIRRTELLHAVKEIGFDSVYLGGFADGELSHSRPECAKKVNEVMSAFAPDVVMGFGPDGYTGHADHMTVYGVAKQVAVEASLPYVAFTLPPEPMRSELLELLRGKRKHGVYQDGLMAHTHTLVVQTDPAHKMEVLKCHTSQFPGLDPHRVFGPVLGEHLLTHEYFTIEN